MLVLAGWCCGLQQRRTLTGGSRAALPPHPTPPPQDCEFTFLSVQILHLLGEEGPHTKDPGERC